MLHVLRFFSDTAGVFSPCPSAKAMQNVAVSAARKKTNKHRITIILFFVSADFIIP